MFLLGFENPWSNKLILDVIKVDQSLLDQYLTDILISFLKQLIRSFFEGNSSVAKASRSGPHRRDDYIAFRNTGWSWQQKSERKTTVG